MMSLVGHLSLVAAILTKRTILVGAGALLASCASLESKPVFVAPTEGLFSVQADFETPIMDSVGDSADDPAIYIGKDGNGFIAGTDKQSGLYIYNLDGSERAFFPVDRKTHV